LQFFCLSLIGLVRGSPHLIVAVLLFDFVYKEGESLFRERKEKGNSLDVVQVVTDTSLD
jgi:hypothetical protein